MGPLTQAVACVPPTLLAGKQSVPWNSTGSRSDCFRFVGSYTIIDPGSPIFLRGDTVYIPTVFVSFYGDALDEKTPLLRAMQVSAMWMSDLFPHLCRMRCVFMFGIALVAGCVQRGQAAAQAPRDESRLRVPQHWS